MRNYYRPIVRTGLDRPDDAFTLADGWCWFTQVAVHQRGQQTAIVPAADAPAKVLTQLTMPRPAIAGMKMDAPRIMGILNVTPDSFSRRWAIPQPGASDGSCCEDGGNWGGYH